MRPLLHIKNNDHFDFEFHQENQELYNELYYRGDKILEEAKNEYEHKEKFDDESVKNAIRELAKGIMEYNERTYYEWKFSGFDEEGFKAWKDSLVTDYDWY